MINNTYHIKTSRPTGQPYDSVMMTEEVTCGSNIIKFDLSPSLTRVELEGEVEMRLNILLQIFSIKYLNTDDDDWILIESDLDLRDGWYAFIKVIGKDYYEITGCPQLPSLVKDITAVLFFSDEGCPSLHFYYRNVI
ncbi:hypothetical protein MTR67_048943 [Solanum verrucosum]|uniref:PB1 domain-containing protein n=1 Tax=Solanum verrucosum TaxID=315347 RepID=A0AAF0V2H3_SOLVR|nr:hypothetical protein MTR67_048943 [Solanum verrucosum]